MKAAIHTRYGPPSVVQIKEVPKPMPKGNEVLIQVHASTINRTDSGFRTAEYVISRLFSGLFKPKRQTLGSEFAGIIETIGPDVRNFKVGDQVFGYDDALFGGHAEYIALPEFPSTFH
jgi:NADPH:quinone reductase-like Zn-dependent oxidoreductase